MGRGRTGIGKIVPPKGWRWAPRTNKYAACVGRLLDKTSTDPTVVGKSAKERWPIATKSCAIKNPKGSDVHKKR